MKCTKPQQSAAATPGRAAVLRDSDHGTQVAVVRLLTEMGSAVVDAGRATTRRTTRHAGNTDGRERAPHDRVSRGDDTLEARHRRASHDIDPTKNGEAQRRCEPD